MLQALDDESCVFVHLGFRVDALVYRVRLDVCRARSIGIG